MAEYCDSELLEIFRSGNESYAFNLLVKKYQRKIYSQVRRMVIDHEDTNDILQNIFIKMWKGLKGFEDKSQLSTWIFRIAVNESLTFLKKKRTKFFIPFVDIEKNLSEKLQSDPYMQESRIELKLQTAILMLPEKQRLVFNMRYYEEMPYEQMSDILETSVGALKASYHHAAKKIELFLTKD